MTEKTDADLRQWLKDNLVIEVEHVDKWGPGCDVYVQLRFKDEPKEFSYDVIHIPSKDDS